MQPGQRVETHWSGLGPWQHATAAVVIYAQLTVKHGENGCRQRWRVGFVAPTQSITAGRLRSLVRC